MKITFPGDLKVDASYRGFTIKTDQPQPSGGGTSPSPFDLFLASLGTCAGIFAVFFCQKRNIPTENISIIQRVERGEHGKPLGKISHIIEVPSNFPEEYLDAFSRSVGLCSVKKVIENPPEFEIEVVVKDRA